MDFTDRIMGCIVIEKAAADFYKTLIGIFPEERSLWEGLIDDEIRHSILLAESNAFAEIGDIEGQILPPGMPYITKTLEFTEGLKEKIRFGTITLEEALRIALMLEESMVESFVNDIIPEDPTSSFVSLEQILIDEKTHVHRLKDFMIKKGFMRVS